MSEGDETNMQWNFIPLNKAERFDRVDVRTVERWKESELSGDEWRYSYVATLYQHGPPMPDPSPDTPNVCPTAEVLVRAQFVDGEVWLVDDEGNEVGVMARSTFDRCVARPAAGSSSPCGAPMGSAHYTGCLMSTSVIVGDRHGWHPG